MRIVSMLLTSGALVAALSGCVAYPAYYSAPVPVVAPAYGYAPGYYGGYGGYYGPSIYVGRGWGGGGYWRR